MIFNVSERDSYDAQKYFQGNVKCFLWPDHHAPTPFTFIPKIAEEASKWINADNENVIVVHCNSGKGRTGTIVCAIMFYLNIFNNLEDCLRLNFEKRGVTVT